MCSSRRVIRGRPSPWSFTPPPNRRIFSYRWRRGEFSSRCGFTRRPPNMASCPAEKTPPPTTQNCASVWKWRSTISAAEVSPTSGGRRNRAGKASLNSFEPRLFSTPSTKRIRPCGVCLRKVQAGNDRDLRQAEMASSRFAVRCYPDQLSGSRQPERRRGALDARFRDVAGRHGHAAVRLLLELLAATNSSGLCGRPPWLEMGLRRRLSIVVAGIGCNRIGRLVSPDPVLAVAVGSGRDGRPSGQYFFHSSQVQRGAAGTAHRHLSFRHAVWPRDWGVPRFRPAGENRLAAAFCATGLGSCAWLVPWVALAPREPVLEIERAVAGTPPPVWRALFATPLIPGILIGAFSYYWYYCLTWLPSYLVMSRGGSPDDGVACGGDGGAAFLAVGDRHRHRQLLGADPGHPAPCHDRPHHRVPEYHCEPGGHLCSSGHRPPRRPEPPLRAFQYPGGRVVVDCRRRVPPAGSRKRLPYSSLLVRRRLTLTPTGSRRDGSARPRSGQSPFARIPEPVPSEVDKTGRSYREWHKSPKGTSLPADKHPPEKCSRCSHWNNPGKWCLEKASAA